jgi:hypothetical protein
MNHTGYYEDLDFSGLDLADAEGVRGAIASGADFYGYIPSDGLDFIIRNYASLARLGILETSWIDAYTHASNFSAYELTTIKAVFDACDRAALIALKPVDDAFGRRSSDRLSLFRGCAGPEHRMGMSWTTSLDKAIWYAAHHAEYFDLENKAVYAAVIPRADIYCRGNHYDEDFIALPRKAWRIDVPDEEFRLDRPR